MRLIVEIIEPYHGRILDPACGSGGMFVHSADFVRRAQTRAGKGAVDLRHREGARDAAPRADEPRGAWPRRHDPRGQLLLRGPFPIVGQFDFVMANPPFNVDGVDKEKDAIRSAKERFPFGLPKPDNANYLWIEMFWSALNDKGPRRLRHGQFRRRCARHANSKSARR